MRGTCVVFAKSRNGQMAKHSCLLSLIAQLYRFKLSTRRDSRSSCGKPIATGIFRPGQETAPRNLRISRRIEALFYDHFLTLHPPHDRIERTDRRQKDLDGSASDERVSSSRWASPHLATLPVVALTPACVAWPHPQAPPIPNLKSSACSASLPSCSTSEKRKSARQRRGHGARPSSGY